MNRPARPVLPASAWRQRLQQSWQARTARERRGLLLAGLLIGAALLWQAGLAPALRTWREGPQQQARLDAERQQLLLLQQQARQLQALPRIGRDEALRWLQGPEQADLGPGAVVRVQGDQVLVQLQAATAEGLTRWLRAARQQARALPVQVQLQQSNAAATAPAPGGASATARPSAVGAGAAGPSATPAKPDAGGGLRWRGNLVLGLPA
jgi:general secretion pathway protein M